MGSPLQASPEDEASSDTRTQRDQCEVVASTARSQPGLGERGGGGVVADGHRQPEGPFQVGAHWVADGAEVIQDARGWGVQMRTLDLHTRVHVRDPGDPNFSSIEDFGPYYGGPFDTSFAELSGIVLHEQTHVEEVRAAWGGLWPDFAARVEAIRAASPGAAEGEYRALFENAGFAVSSAHEDLGLSSNLVLVLQRDA